MGSLPNEKYINLQLGWPTPSLFPTEALVKAAQNTLLDGQTAAEALVYGPDPGHETLRKATAEWLEDFYCPEAGHIDPKRLFITNGASGALGMILSRFTDPGFTRRIWMVEPTYFLACPTFQEAGFEGRLRGIPEDDEGIDIQYLRQQIIRANDEDSGLASTLIRASNRPKLYRHVVYAVPTFSNPSAKVMSLQRRRQLIQLAREFDALVITDDVYDWLRWPVGVQLDGPNNLQPPPPRLVDIDRSLPNGNVWGNAVSNGSFSKIVAPGVRVGWVEATPNMVLELCKSGSVNSGGSQGHLSSMMVCQLLTSGTLQRYISSTLIPTYERRYRAMISSIKQNLQPLGFEVSHSAPYETQPHEVAVMGGFFLYLIFPHNSPPVKDVAKVALEVYNLRIAHGDMMVVAGDEGSMMRARKTFGRGARLCWAWHDEKEIDEGIQRLAQAFVTSRKA